VVHRAREHPRQLGCPDARLERRHLPRSLRDGRLVVALGPEVQKDDGVVQVPRQLLDGAEMLLDRGALAGDDLRLLLVVPETGGERLLLEPVDFRLQLRQVKDAPLAP
jgi:hypothetical protein